MREWIDKYGKVVLNALLAGFWLALGLFADAKDPSIQALLAAGGAGLRFAVGLILKAVGSLPTIPVDE